MPSSRERIFQALRRGLKRGPEDAAAQASVNARLRDTPRNLIPARAQLPQPQQVELFVEKATALTATVARVTTPAEVPAAVADYLAQNNLTTDIRMAPDPWLEAIDWTSRPLLRIETGAGRSRDLVSLTPAFAAIAETGTLMMHSGPHGATTLNFVPDNHIVVLRREQITGSMEDAFARLRQAVGGAASWPRSVNLVTGPSRTADIEGIPVLGAHGPRQLHIILVEAADAGQDQPA